MIVLGIVFFGFFVFFVVILIILILINENNVIWNDIKNLEVFFGKILCWYKWVKFVLLNGVLNVNKIMIIFIMIKVMIVIILMIVN